MALSSHISYVKWSLMSVECTQTLCTIQIAFAISSSPYMTYPDITSETGVAKTLCTCPSRVANMSHPGVYWIAWTKNKVQCAWSVAIGQRPVTWCGTSAWWVCSVLLVRTAASCQISQQQTPHRSAYPPYSGWLCIIRIILQNAEDLSVASPCPLPSRTTIGRWHLN